VFSGLVWAVGTIRGFRRQGSGAALDVECALGGEPLGVGESVAVSGACLTVARVVPRGFAADVSPETLARTTLGRAAPGARVNLERAMRLSDRLGGHLVLGHVDATVRVLAVRPAGEFTVVRLALPPAQAKEVAEKGSVAVDGVSLTVAAVGADWFEVAAIPVTLAATTLGERRRGDEVNLETDVLAKYVRRVVGGGGAGLEALWAGFNDAAD